MAHEETPLRVGLIGLGAVAEAHLASTARAVGARVVAGADLDPARRTTIAARWAIRGYADVGEMLDREQLDIACVLTPALTHRAMALEAARRGVHVLCEKPLAATLEDARAIVADCAAHGVRLAYGSTYRFLPAVRAAKDLVVNGRLGELCLLTEGFVGGAGPEAWRDLGPHHYPSGGPGGGGMGLIDHGVHLVDVFRWLTASEVTAVVGRGNVSGGRPATEFLTMLFASGAVGQLVYNEATFGSDLPSEGTFSWGGRWAPDGRVLPGGGWDPHPLSIRVHGSCAALRLFPYANQLFLFEGGGVTQVPLDGPPMPGNFTLQLESFAARIRRDEEPEVTGADGVRALEVVFAAYRSFAERRFVVPGRDS